MHRRLSLPDLLGPGVVPSVEVVAQRGGREQRRRLRRLRLEMPAHLLSALGIEPTVIDRGGSRDRIPSALHTCIPAFVVSFYASRAAGANATALPRLLLSHTGATQPLVKRLPPSHKDRIAVRVRPFVPLHHRQRVARLGKAPVEFLQL